MLYLATALTTLKFPTLYNEGHFCNYKYISIVKHLLYTVYKYIILPLVFP